MTQASSNASYEVGYPPYPYDKERDEALEYLKVECVSTDGWSTFDNKGGVTYEKKTIPGDSSAIPLVRGRGIVEGFTPKQFLSLISYVGCRSAWDTRTEKAEMLARFGRHLCEFYAIQKGFGWIIQQRDIVGCQDTRFDDDGIYRVQTSVNDPSRPPVSGKTRATLTLAGWVLRPHENGVDVTYVVKINPNGSIPTSIINNTIVPEIPAAISNCNNVLKGNGFPPHVSEGMTSVLKSEDFDFGSKMLKVVLRAKSGDSFDVEYDAIMFNSRPNFVVDGEGKGDVKVEHEEAKFHIAVGEAADGQEIILQLS